MAIGLAVSFSNLEDSPSAPIAFLLSRLDSPSIQNYMILGECQNLLHHEFWNLYMIRVGADMFGADTLACGR